MERGVTSMLLFGDAPDPSSGFYEALCAERLVNRCGMTVIELDETRAAKIEEDGQGIQASRLRRIHR